MTIDKVNNIYFNLSSNAYIPPSEIDNMRVYMALVYARRITELNEKLSEGSKPKAREGTSVDFFRYFG